MKYLIIILFSSGAFAQQLHRQMISSQGGTHKTAGGIVVRATVGQSVTGTSKKHLAIQQGFQQNHWGRLISESSNSEITTTTFPNPYTDVVNFKFTDYVGSEIAISVFDLAGREVVSATLNVNNNNEASIFLGTLPQSQYLVRLIASNFEYFTKIIKR